MNGFARGLVGLTILAGVCVANGISGCATGTEIDGPATVSGEDTDSGGPADDGGGGSNLDDGGNDIISQKDGGSGGSMDSGGGNTKDSSGPCVGVVVINEVQTYGATASDEFVELYNTQPCALSLNKYTLNYSSASGSTPNPLFVGGSGDSIPANGFFLLGGAGFTAPAGGKIDGTLTGGLADSARIAILDGSSKVVDSVGFGTLTGGNTYVEKNAAVGPAHLKSIGRDAKGTDTDNNQVDFTALSSPSPGKAN